MASEKAHAAAGYLPAGQTRKARRARAKQAAKILADARKRASADTRAALEAEKAERKQHAYLPRGGEPRRAALRSYRRLRLQPHRATSEVLAGAYPFLAEAGLGAAGTFIGQDAWSGAGFCFDPWTAYAHGHVTNPNVLLAGVIGKGKTTLGMALATRSLAFGRRVYTPCDPKGEWGALARQLGGASIALGSGSGNRLNPLDEGPRNSAMTDAEWRATVVRRRRKLIGALTVAALSRPMTSVEHTALDLALRAAVTDNTTPTLPMVVEALFRPTVADDSSTLAELTVDGRPVAHALRRLVAGDLAGLFDGPSTVCFDPSLPMVAIDQSAIADDDQLLAMVMTCASAWMEAALSDPRGGQRWVVYDEGWRLLKEPTMLARMQSEWKLARTFGVANLLIVHRLSDLDAVGDAGSQARGLATGLLSDISTRIIYQQETNEAPHAGKLLGLSVTEQAELPNLQRGEGLWRVGQHAFVVRHLATQGELDLYATHGRIAENPTAMHDSES